MKAPGKANFMRNPDEAFADVVVKELLS